jgi:hypothetical protein
MKLTKVRRQRLDDAFVFLKANNLTSSATLDNGLADTEPVLNVGLLEEADNRRSGNIQWTFGEHSVNIRWTFSEALDNVLADVEPELYVGLLEETDHRRWKNPIDLSMWYLFDTPYTWPLRRHSVPHRLEMMVMMIISPVKVSDKSVKIQWTFIEHSVNIQWARVQLAGLWTLLQGSEMYSQ